MTINGPSNQSLYGLSEKDRQGMIQLIEKVYRGTINDPNPALPANVCIGKVVSEAGIPKASSETAPGHGKVRLYKLTPPGLAGEPVAVDFSLPDRRLVPVEDHTPNDATPYEVDAYNLSEEYEYALNEWCLVAPLAHGKYSILPIPSNNVGGKNGTQCPCGCAETSDLTVGGVATTTLMVVNLPQIKDEQANGDIILPAASHDLLWDSVNSYWKKVITTELIALYNSGNDATGDTTMSGDIIFRKDDSGYTTLTVSITGTVPVE